MPNERTVRDINKITKPRIDTIINDVRGGAQFDNAIIDEEERLLDHVRPTRQSLGFLDQLRDLRAENEEQVATCDNFMKWITPIAVLGELNDEVCE